MTMTVMFDSSAWIEYFSGSKLGTIAKGYVDSTETIFTSVISVLEIKNKYQREGKKWKSRSSVLNVRYKCNKGPFLTIYVEI